MIGGIIGTSIGLIQARTQQRRAEAGEELARERLVQVESEKKKAEEEKQIAVAVRHFLQNKLLGQADVTAQANALLATGDPSAAAKRDTTIRELLDRTAEEPSEVKIEASFPNQPLLQAEILRTVGDTYRGVGDYERAIGLLQRSLALRKAKLGPDHPDTLMSMHHLALVYLAVGKMDLALPLLEETLKLKKAKFGPEHPETLWTTNDLALTYQDAGKLDLALPLSEETLKFWKAKLGPEHPDTLHSMAALRTLRLEIKTFGEAEPLLRERLPIREKTQPDVWSTLKSQSMLGGALLGQKKYAEAEPLVLKDYQGMKQREKSIPPQASHRISPALDRLIELYTATNKPDEFKKWRVERAKYPAAPLPPPQKK